MPDKIWIIGCGDIGRRVARLYADQDADQNFQSTTIAGIVHSAESVSSCKKLGVDAHAIDFDQPFTLSDLPEKISSRIYYFMPPPSQGREDTRLKRFLKHLDKSKKRIVLISTSGVYGDSKGAWINEDTPPKPVAERAFRRLSAEQTLIQWAAQSGSDYMILRVPGIYAKERLPLARLKKGLPVVSQHEAGWTNRIHADDLARACKASMESAHCNQIINICDGHPSTMTDYFNQIADYAGLPRPPQISMQEAEKTLSKGMLSYLKESRRIENHKMLKLLNLQLQYPDLKSFCHR